MLLRIGSTLAATVMFGVMGTGLALWGINILPWAPLRVGFIALVVATCLVALRAVSRDPRLVHTANSRARAARVPEPTLVTTPASSPIGMCWQCGSPVRESNLVCLRCGATQPQRHELLPAIIPGKETDWDKSEMVYHVPEPEVLPTGSLPIYRVGLPDGWSEGDGGILDAPPAEGARWLPAPQIAHGQTQSEGGFAEDSLLQPVMEPPDGVEVLPSDPSIPSWSVGESE